MSTAITLKDIMIHPVVEQQAPFFDPLEFFPTLTKDVLEEDCSWLQPTFIDPDTGRLVLCVQGFVIKTRTKISWSILASGIISRDRHDRSGT